MQYDAERIIEEMIENTKLFIEKPHSIFGNLPVCPFAKKARLRDQLMYLVYPFDATQDPIDEGRMLAEIAAFRTTGYLMLWVIHPDKGLPHDTYNQFFLALRSRIAPEGLTVFPGHPRDDFSVNGLAVRRDPYPNLQVLSTAELELARSKLRKTRYYDKLSGYQLES